MNYVILIGIALFFIATAVHNGSGGWEFDRGQFNFRAANAEYTLRVRGDGGVDLHADGSGVASLVRGHSLDVLMTRNGNERRVLFTGADGAIERQFFVEGEPAAWSAEADAFVAEVMPIVLRETALNAGERVAWLLANRGQAGLLDEIGLIDSDFAQRIYTVHYAQTAEISAADFERLMRLAAENMSSDFDLRTTLIQVFDSQQPAGESLGALLEAGETISSDFDTRMMLDHVGSNMPLTPEAVDAYLDVARTISSDFDLRLVLQSLLSRFGSGDEAAARALELGGAEISSDFDLRLVLTEASGKVGSSDTLARAYAMAADSIDSDFDHRLALTALGENAALTPEGWRLLFESARDIDSDFDAATLLTELVPHLPRDESVVDAYRQAMNTIGSDFDRGRAAAALDGARR